MEVESLRRYVAVRKELDEIDIVVKALTAERDKLEEELLVQFEQDGMQNTRIDDRLVYLHKSTFASADPEHGGMPALIDALNAEGLGDLAKTTVNGNTLRAYVNEQLKANRPIPTRIDNVIKLTEKFSLRVRT